MIIEHSNIKHLLPAAVCMVLSISCLSERELPPPPKDLAERSKAFSELEKQLGLLKQANAEEASFALKHEDYRVRQRAARHMGVLGDSSKHFLKELLGALKDNEPSVRLEAAVALGKIGDERAVEPLISALADKDPQVRLRIWKAIKKFGTSAISALIPHLSRTSPTKKLAFKDESGKKQLLSQEIVRRFPSFGKSALPHLIEALGSEDDWVRKKAIIIVGSLEKKAKDALPILTSLLEEEEGIANKIRIVKTIGKIGDLHPTVVPALQKATRSKNKKLKADAKRLLKEFKKDSKKTGKKATQPNQEPKEPKPDLPIDTDSGGK